MVGKTSFMNMFVNQEFSSQYKATLTTDILLKEVDINGTLVNLQIWDTAGREFGGYEAFYRRVEGAFLVYDTTEKKSFESIPQWRKELRNQCDSLPMILVGLKCDLEDKRAVSTKVAQAVADSWGIPFIEVSSKENINIEQSFLNLFEEMRKQEEQRQAKINQSECQPETSNGFFAWLHSLFSSKASQQ